MDLVATTAAVKPKSTSSLGLANTLSLARMGAVPVVVGLLYFPGKTTCLVATAIFVAAALTDLLDGYIARDRGEVTTLGKFLDPLADKMIVVSSLIMLVGLGWVPAWLAILIVLRELAVTGLRAIAMDSGKVIAADKFGKMKTLAQIVGLSFAIAHYELSWINPEPIGTILLYLALALTLYSGIRYLYGFFKQ